MDRLTEILQRLANTDAEPLTDEEVGSLEAELIDAFAKLRAGELGGVPKDDLATAQNISETLGALRTEAEVRLTAAAEREVALDALAAEINPVLEDEGLADAEGELTIEVDDAETADTELAADDTALEADTDTDEKPTVSEKARSMVSAMARTRPAHVAPLKREFAKMARDLQTGTAVDLDGAAEVLNEGIKQFSVGEVPEGFNQKIKLVSFPTGDYTDRTLPRDPEAAFAMISDLIAGADRPEFWSGPEMEPILATGGWCAPAQVIYDVNTEGVVARPVRDGLPGVKATRGSIAFTPMPSLSTIVTTATAPPTEGSAIGVITNAGSIAGHDKSVQAIDCPSQTTETLDSIYRILQFGNLIDRSFPEYVRAFQDLAMVAWARYGEERLLAQITSRSSAVNGNPQRYSAARDILSEMNRLAARIKGHHRMDPNRVMRVILPWWIVPMLQDDISFQIPEDMGQFDLSEASIRSWFAARNINVTFTLDGETTTGLNAQELPAQTAGSTVAGWPDQLVWKMFPEGTFVFLDNGTLELGTVRDSVLNDTNDFQTFFESFEGLAKFGIEAWNVTSTLCANGAYAAGVTPVCAGS